VIQDKIVGKTLLIKPFEVRSSSDDLSNISKSLTDHLIASLPSTILLNVVPRRKSYLVSEEAYSNERMQKELDVSFILSGTLSESKSRVRINLELSNIYDENIVWSSTEEFQKDDMFSAQDKLERIVRRAIQSNLTMGESFISYYEKNFSDYEDLLEIRRLDVLTYKENVSIVKGLAQPYEKFVEKYKNSAAYALYALRLLQETNVVKDTGAMDAYNKAVRAQFQAYKLDPENARAIHMKALFSLLNTGTLDEGLVEKAISIAPESFDVLYGVGTAYRFARKPLLAVGMYEKALNIAPLAPTDTKLNYLRALIDSKKFSKAERVSKEMTGLDKHSSYWGYLFLIYINFENNKKDDAIRLYKEFLKMNEVSLDDIISEIKRYPWSWDVWYKLTLADSLREIDKLSKG
jgi:TolB-like protein